MLSKQLGVIWLLLLLCSSTLAQFTFKGKVLDDKSKQPLAFVNILTDRNYGATTDIDGNFVFNTKSPIQSIKLSYVGYESKEIQLSGKDFLIIYMSATTFQLEEVKILPGENPAHRIIKKVVDNRTQLNPEKSMDFTYDSYSKLYVTAEMDSALVNDPEKLAKADSMVIRTDSILKTQHIFMMESITQRKYKVPSKNYEKVIASRVSGLQNPTFALLGTQLQSFSFYNTNIYVMDKAYLNPISTNSHNKYLFIIEDTIISGVDSVYIISFTPLKGKNFDALQGLLYINTDGYALQNVIAEPYEQEASLTIKIRQQYEKIEGKWFPKQLSSKFIMNNATINSFKMVGISNTYIKDVVVNPELKNKEFSHIDTEIDLKANKRDEDFWNEYRGDTLTAQEEKTYQVIDSIGKAENFDKKLGGLEAILTGKLKWGVVDLDLNRFVNYNNYEGFRLGAGFHTNQHFSKWFSIGGYGAYGFKDKEEKYGGDATFLLEKNNNIAINFSYDKDVAEPGVVGFRDYKVPFISSGGTRVLYLDRMNNYEKMQARLSFRTLRYLKTYAFVNQQKVEVTDNYYFVKQIDNSTFIRDRNYLFNEVGVELRYAYKEKILKTLSNSYRTATKYPILYAKIERGINQYEGEYAYTRYTFRTEKKFNTRNFGQPYFRVEVGYTDGKVPQHLLNHPIGVNRTDDFLLLSTENAFETMLPYEFLSNQYVHFHFRHSFKGLLLKIKKFQPEFVITTSAGVGSLDHAELHQGVVFNTMEKGFYESGLIINNIFKLNSTTFGVGGFYRYGPYAFDKTSDNFAVKMSFGVIF